MVTTMTLGATAMTRPVTHLRRAWHFVRSNGRLTHDLAHVVTHPGLTVAVEPSLLCLCSRGLHWSLCVYDALDYAPSFRLCRVRVGGTILHRTAADKGCSSRRTILWMADVRATVAAWTYACADRALRIHAADRWEHARRPRVAARLRDHAPIHDALTAGRADRTLRSLLRVENAPIHALHPALRALHDVRDALRLARHCAAHARCAPDDARRAGFFAVQAARGLQTRRAERAFQVCDIERRCRALAPKG